MKQDNIASVKDFIKDLEQLDVEVGHGPETPKWIKTLNSHDPADKKQRQLIVIKRPPHSEKSI